MTKLATKRDYCSGCRRWIATWHETPWGGSWEKPTMRSIFGKYCDHGKWCQVCWAKHHVQRHVPAPASPS